MYSIQIFNTPKTFLHSRWNIFKWKSKAREHEVGRNRIIFTERGTSNSNLEVSWYSRPTSATSMIQTWGKWGSCPLGTSGKHGQPGLASVPAGVSLHWLHGPLYPSVCHPSSWTPQVGRSVLCCFYFKQMQSKQHLPSCYQVPGSVFRPLRNRIPEKVASNYVVTSVYTSTSRRAVSQVKRTRGNPREKARRGGKGGSTALCHRVLSSC